MIRQPVAIALQDGGLLLRSDAAALVRDQLRDVVKARLDRTGTVPAPLALVFGEVTRALAGSGVGSTEVPERAELAWSFTDEIDAAEAARILACSDRYVRSIASSLDGRKTGGRWTFDRSAVVAYRNARKDLAP